MKKVYVIAPLAALLAFGGFYWQHQRVYQARLAAERRVAEDEKERKRLADLAARNQAHALALAAAEQRRRDRAAKDEIEAARREARAEAEQRRARAATEERKLRTRLDQLQPQLAALEATVARTVERRRELQQEQLFLARYVEAAEENRTSFLQLLEQLERLERLRPTAPRATVPSPRG